MYSQGQGIPRNDKTTVKWLTLAAEQGHANAQFNLGWMYDNGYGVPKNDKVAVKWFTLSAEQGYASAQFNLGVMYYFGEGVIQNIVYAHMWLKIAASQGNKDAIKNRDLCTKAMTAAQIEKAQDLIIECGKKKYKGCLTGGGLY